VNETPPLVIGVLISSEPIASAFKEVLVRAGYEVVMEIEQFATRQRVESAEVSAWVSDTSSDQVFDWLFGTGKLLFPANNAPNVGQRKEFYQWSSDLLLQINIAFKEPFPEVRTPDSDFSSSDDMWLLVGSAGAPSAVQLFLNSFKSLPPVGFVYAQHFAVQDQQVLAQLSAENPLFSMEVGVGFHTVEAGRVIVVPPQCQIRFDDFGNITSTRSPWNPPYTPNIEQLFTLFSGIDLSPAGVIVFSGMGDDGASSLGLLHQSGTRIWSQSLQSSICDSMPQSALNTGLVDIQGAPEQLAAALQELYDPMQNRK